MKDWLKAVYQYITIIDNDMINLIKAAWTWINWLTTATTMIIYLTLDNYSLKVDTCPLKDMNFLATAANSSDKAN